MPADGRNEGRRALVIFTVIVAAALAVGTNVVSLVADPGVWKHVQITLDRIVKFLWPMAVALAAVGTATMAGFQMAKDLFHLRRNFNRRQVAAWLDERAAQCAPPRSADAAEASLIMLATAGEADAYYSLESDKLAGQTAAAARIVVDAPHGHEDLLYCLAAHWTRLPGGAKDLALVANPPRPPAASASDADKQRARDEAGPYLEAKNRVATAIQRSLDGFQIRLDFRWKHWNQRWVFLINVGFVIVAMAWHRVNVGQVPTTWPAYLAVGLLAGFVSPLAKDLVGALETLKGRKR